jgi:HlyD family secretion protein
MVIVPNDSSLEIEAMVSNHDVGFVHAGDEVEIKVDTFDFTRYGLLHGRVQSISSDAIVRDAPSDKSNEKQPGSNAASSEGQELTYAARVSVDRTQMQVEDKKVNLSPGMAVTAEIKTGSRRIISYLLSPLINTGKRVCARDRENGEPPQACPCLLRVHDLRQVIRSRPVSFRGGGNHSVGSAGARSACVGDWGLLGGGFLGRFA